MTTTLADAWVDAWIDANLKNTRRIEYRAFYDARVAAGVAYLDEAVAGWRERIDMDTLDLRSGLNCVLAQVYGRDFYDVRSAIEDSVDRAPISADTQDVPGSTYWCERRGFTVTETDAERTEQLRWEALQAAWVAELTQPA